MPDTINQQYCPEKTQPGLASKSLLPQFWYIVAESKQLDGSMPVASQVLDEWLVCYRDETGQAVVARDRCIHRCARLSCGTLKGGRLTCGYHGWVYGQAGQVTDIPGEREHSNLKQRGLHAKTYLVLEQDGYVYVCLEPGSLTPLKPFELPSDYSANGHIRLTNRFQNSLANCVENYIDVPHTAYVHHGIFRKPKAEEIKTTVTRQNGEVKVCYHGEGLNLGNFSWFLNPARKEIIHTDRYYSPNITSVHYLLPNGYRYAITSQSIPVSNMETLVYTDIHYDFGFWTPFAEKIVRQQAQAVIDQDIEILKQQAEVIEKYGQHFCPTSADTIHTYISEIIQSLMAGQHPEELPDKNEEVCFYV